jgi:putative endonuclease
MPQKNKKPPFFWIYMLECENGSYYTGYSTNLARRFRQHVEGTANVKYTRTHKPVRIAQCWRLYDTVGTALKVEKIIKTIGRQAKDRLVGKPAAIKTLVASRLGGDVEIFTFDPATAERAAWDLPADDIKTAADPLASIPRGDC